MANIDVINLNGTKVGSVELLDAVFCTEVKNHLVWEAVRHHLARRRAGTACAKGRGDVSGGGRKPWRQKGTGRARVGSTRNPLWKGGGVAHGPRPRSYDYAFPKKMRQGALRSILSQRLAADRIRVIDEIRPEEPKTKAFVIAARNIGIENSLFIDTRDNDILIRVTNNVPTMHVLDHFALNPYDLLRFKTIVFSKEAIEKVNEALRP